MLRFLPKLAAASAALALVGCQTTMPPYLAAPNAAQPGYFSQPSTGENRYTVTYTGTTKMKRPQVAEYALLRAAEYTLEMGQEWFAVLSTNTEALTQEEINSLAGRSGAYLGNDSASGGSGGDSSGAGPGVDDGSFQTGPSTGGFGGGDVPYQVLERWTPPKMYQTTLIIQMGSGDEASFPGVTVQPEIFDAKTIATEIRAKMSG